MVTKKPPFNTSPITSCAINNLGTVVVGHQDGEVIRINRTGEQFSIFKFKQAVKSVSIDLTDRYVTALSEWQHEDCSHSGLPGQPMVTWDNQQPRKMLKIVSERCLPNLRISNIGAIIEQDNKMLLPIVTGKIVDLKPCIGCGASDESDKDILQRLIDAAEDKRATSSENQGK